MQQTQTQIFVGVNEYTVRGTPQGRWIELAVIRKMSRFGDFHVIFSFFFLFCSGVFQTLLDRASHLFHSYSNFHFFHLYWNNFDCQIQHLLSKINFSGHDMLRHLLFFFFRIVFCLQISMLLKVVIKGCQLGYYTDLLLTDHTPPSPQLNCLSISYHMMW